ncbi:hypothetical protein [Qipengyuania huizhouensis]|uniref:hypothetical protein n=1 Tax=Qipengyuania huizhouensis TaxID=2867245 RepID=UPI0017A3B7F5|nr:hypothetical protein [Qipengyuania huizhouensis]MBA4765617.1 hypothetical protein [Erythrobacter sp.]MBX7461490.1 hypothetical protein [Qipengyuania huizhouensis]
MARIFALALIALPLASCAVIPDTPRVGKDAAAQGTPVGIGEPVWTGDAILTPLAVVEDSRCPENARCVWAGKLTVSTRITSTHWAQTVDLTLGEPHEVLSRTYVLVSGLPEKRQDRETQPGEYRFVYERR